MAGISLNFVPLTKRVTKQQQRASRKGKANFRAFNLSRDRKVGNGKERNYKDLNARAQSEREHSIDGFYVPSSSSFSCCCCRCCCYFMTRRRRS